MASIESFIKIAVLIAVAFSPSIIYMIWIRNTEKYNREPWGAIAKAFVFGMTISVFLAIILGGILIGRFERSYVNYAENPTIYVFVVAVIIAPLVEEFTKALGIFTVGKELDEVEDGLIYGAACGLGFAAVENVLYEGVAWQRGLLSFILVASVRSISSVLLHASATAITGYGIGLVYAKKMNFLVVIPFFIVAVFMHALFNFIALIGELWNILFLALGIAIIFAIGSYKFVRGKIESLDRGY